MQTHQCGQRITFEELLTNFRSPTSQQAHPLFCSYSNTCGYAQLTLTASPSNLSAASKERRGSKLPLFRKQRATTSDSRSRSALSSKTSPSVGRVNKPLTTFCRPNRSRLGAGRWALQCNVTLPPAPPGQRTVVNKSGDQGLR